MPSTGLSVSLSLLASRTDSLHQMCLMCNQIAHLHLIVNRKMSSQRPQQEVLSLPATSPNLHSTHLCRERSPCFAPQGGVQCDRQELEKWEKGGWGKAGTRLPCVWRETKPFQEREPGETFLGVRPSQDLSPQRDGSPLAPCAK